MKNLLVSLSAIAAAAVFGLSTEPADAHDVMAASKGTVKITAIGSHDGEFCGRDRAMIFEDPDGTRIIYDVGRTVAGPDDPRLGKIDVVLLSSVHGDHLGDQRIPNVGAGACGKPKTNVKMAPSSNTAAIIAGKKARSYAGGEMRNFLRAQVKALGGNAKMMKYSSVTDRRMATTLSVNMLSSTTGPISRSRLVSAAFLTMLRYSADSASRFSASSP